MDIIENLVLAASWLAKSVDWMYMLTFIMFTWLVTRMFGDYKFYTKLSTKLKTKWWVFIAGFVWGLLFGIIYWLKGPFPWNATIEVPYSLAIVISTMVAMFLNEYIGFDKLLDRIFKIE